MYFSSCRWFSPGPAPLPGGHVSRTGRGLPGHIPGWPEQRHAAARAPRPCFPREEAHGVRKGYGCPSEGTGVQSVIQAPTKRFQVSTHFRNTSSLSGVSLPFSPRSVRCKTFKLEDLERGSQIKIQPCAEFLLFSFVLYQGSSITQQLLTHCIFIRRDFYRTRYSMQRICSCRCILFKI